MGLQPQASPSEGIEAESCRSADRHPIGPETSDTSPCEIFYSHYFSNEAILSRANAMTNCNHMAKLCSTNHLSESERKVFNAMTDQFMSTSVVKIRSGIPSTERNSSVIKICHELERLGLAERRGSGLRSTIRWRRATR